LHPSADPGRFNLEIDGATAGGAAAVGDGGTTGTIAVSSGQHTVGESAASGADLTKYFTQIVCRNGDTVVATATVASVPVPVGKDEDVVCAITNTLKSEAKPLVPLVECVVFRNGTPDTAVWGYRNDNGFGVQLPVGVSIGFAPAPPDRGQPTTFEPGAWTGVFETSMNGAATLTWSLAGQRPPRARRAATRR
jgi:hypothetical protein